MIFVQIFLGYWHHLNYKKYGKRTIQSYLHIWWGRAAIILGMINAGLGLQLAFAPRNWEIVYSVVVGVVALTYVVAYLFTSRSRRRAYPKEGVSNGYTEHAPADHQHSAQRFG